MKASKTIDMCNGPLFSKLLLYALPLAATGVLQLLYNAADLVVVGKFTGDNALAAVGSTSSLVNLIVNLFMGLSVGVTAVVARHYGAGDETKIRESVHTAMTLSVISGIIVMIIGLILCEPLLILMDTPDEVLPLSVLYLRIYFLGMPAMMIYNFGAGILRAVGNTKHPLIFLAVSGMINVILNLVLVVGFGRGVDGVAIATVVSQVVSATLVVHFLTKNTGSIRLEPSRLGVHRIPCIDIMRIGIPAGIQSSVFSVSNVLIQSSINGFGPVAMAGSTAAGNIEGFVYIVMNAFSQAALTFTGQNLGAKKPERISKVLRQCSLLVFVSGAAMGLLCLLFQDTLLGIYTDDPQVIEMGAIRLQIIISTYFLCGIMEVISGVLRGMGYSTTPMITSLIGACGFRILWIYTIFRLTPTLAMLYISYPVSWVLTVAAHLICYAIVRPRLFRRLTKNTA